MKQVVKVSIAGVSFTLENDAHALLEGYITELKEHYKNEQSSQEIIDDIEERIMELLVERGLRDKVVEAEDVNSIIEILGKPKDIDAESGCGESSGSASSADTSRGADCAENRRVKKKLYRDLNNRVLGGVCGGLGAYFNIDAVAVRLIFVIVAFLFPLLRALFGFAVVLYIILWIIIPPAKTVAQRCAMNGESVGIDDIQKRVQVGAKVVGNEVRELSSTGIGKFFNVIGYFISFCIGLLLLGLGFTGIVCGSLVCIGVEFFEGITALGALEYIELGLDNTLLIKVLAILVWFLPCIGMIYGGLALCFRFKSPKWRPGLIMFILWMVSLIAFIIVGVRAMNPYYNVQSEYVNTELPANYDTLYIKLQDFAGKAESKRYLERSNPNDLSKNYSFYNTSYVKKLSNGKYEFIDYPNIRVRKELQDEMDTDFTSYIECRYNSYEGFNPFSLPQEFKTSQVFNIQDSLITINYRVFNIDKKYRGEKDKLYIHVPENTVIKILE